MNTRIIMTTSAVFLAIIGISLTFFPVEIANYLNIGFQSLLILTLQVMGGLFFGFAMLNWMTKDSVIGGIYNKPLVTANMAQFMVGGLALLKDLIHHPDKPAIIWVVTGFYVIFGLVFVILFMRSPVKG